MIKKKNFSFKYAYAEFSLKIKLQDQSVKIWKSNNQWYEYQSEQKTEWFYPRETFKWEPVCRE